MCLRLGELRKAFADYAASFDAATVAPAELASALSDAGAVEKMAATIGSLLAARMARGAGLGNVASSQAERLAVQSLARASGISQPEAARCLQAAQAFERQAELAAAAKAGELSRGQVGLLAPAALANPGALGELVETARKASLSELAEQARRARAAKEDLDAARARLQAAREVRFWTGPDGARHMASSSLPEQAAMVEAALGAKADELFGQARKQGRRERPGAYLWDALVALVTGGGEGCPRAEVLVRVDHSALLRGYAIEGELCEVPGFGAITPKAITDMMDSGDPFLKAIVTKGKDIVGVVHLGRRPNAYQQSALDWLYPRCAAEGCGTRAEFLQTDHRLDWSRSHVTIFDLLDRLCPFHHRLKTTEGWQLVEGRGKRPFVAPSDPRHPRHSEQERGLLHGAAPPELEPSQSAQAPAHPLQQNDATGLAKQPRRSQPGCQAQPALRLSLQADEHILATGHDSPPP